MNNYNFLFKPFFFIGSLLFATWLVLYIEKINPSDLGKYEHVFTSRPQSPPATSAKDPIRDKQEKLMKLCRDYKAGLIDSTEVKQHLEIFLSPASEASGKQ